MTCARIAVYFFKCRFKTVKCQVGSQPQCPSWESPNKDHVCDWGPLRFSFCSLAALRRPWNQSKRGSKCIILVFWCDCVWIVADIFFGDIQQGGSAIRSLNDTSYLICYLSIFFFHVKYLWPQLLLFLVCFVMYVIKESIKQGMLEIVAILE